MAEILAVGFAVPRRRLSGELLDAAWRPPSTAAPENVADGTADGDKKRKRPAQARAVVGYDEDAITLAVQSAWDALDSLRGSHFDAQSIDCLIFASTTFPFLERSPSAFVKETLGLADGVRTLNVSGSIAGGIDALLTANDLVDRGAHTTALVLAADTRTAPPGDPSEALLGDAGCAFVLGTSRGGGSGAAPALASIGIAARATATTADPWRVDGERTLRSDDVRLARSHYARLTRQALEALSDKGVALTEFDGVIPYAPDPKSGMRVVKSIGLDVRRHYRDFASIHLGLCGSAHVPLMLAAALVRAAPKERLLVLSYGDGASAFVVETSPESRESAGFERLDRAIAAALPVRSYAKYLESRGLIGGRHEGGEVFASEAMLDREKGRFLRLEAGACRSCGALYYTDVKRCPSCGAEEGFERRRLARTGTVFTFTREHYYPTPEPPLTMAVLDLDGGGRVTLQVADDDASVEIGTPVELVLRRMHGALGRPNYFWKCRKRI